MDLAEVIAAIRGMEPTDRAEFQKTVLSATKGMQWVPNPGPQTLAYFSEADEVFYGGAAGGGKTDLLLGLALTSHRRTLILRREGTDLGAIESRMESILGSRDGYNGQKRELRYRDPGGMDRFLEMGSCPHEKDKFAYQGQPHDLKCFDEITQFSESQYRYIIGWNRTTVEGQRCRIVCAGNPPSTAEGQWVKRRWRPWLDPQYPHPAAPGELCYFTTINGEDVEVDFDWVGRDDAGEPIYPTSRTFIPALLTDNPYVNAEYRGRLQALPEPLRSQLLYGDMQISEKDGANQIIPTAWVRAAQARWKEEGRQKRMLCIGADIAQGGDDKCSYAPRHEGNFIDNITTQPGSENKDGTQAAGVIVGLIRDRACVAPDMGGGYGTGVKIRLEDANVRVAPFVPAAKPTRMTKDGALKFKNMRAQAWWGAREKLDPSNREPWSLPPNDEELVADLTAPTWTLTSSGIVVEPKEQVKERLGRSTDKGDSVVQAMDCDPGPLTVEEAYETARKRREMMAAETNYSPYGPDAT